MQNNLFAEISALDEKIQKFRVSPPKLSAAHHAGFHIPNEKGRRGTLGNKRRKSSSSSSVISDRVRQDKGSFATYFRVSIDNVDKVIENNILRTSFVIYQIRFTRLSDLADRAVWKRYKELYTFYLEVVRDITGNFFSC